MAKKTPSIPKTPGACADKLMELREAKAAAQKIVDGIDAQMTAIEEHLINTLPADDAEGIIGKVAKAIITKKTIPTVAGEDWDKVYKYIAKHDAFDMLQRRLNTKAVNDRWEAGEKIPGVTTFVKKSVSITKAH